MKFSILGTLAVHDDEGRPVPVGGTRLRALLAILLLEPGRGIGAERLIDEIWDGVAPAGAANALQALVSRLRRALGEAAPLRAEPAGYRLDIDPADVDLWRFEELVEQGRRARAEGRVERAAELLDAALALWRGPADVLALPGGRGVAVRLAELRGTVTEERLGLALDLGEHARALPDIEAVAAQSPSRERPTALLMRALAASGRTAEALAAYDKLRRVLVDELGIDPSPELRALHVRLLRGELDPRPERPLDDEEEPPAVRLPPTLTSFVGRAAEVRAAVDLVGGGRLVTLTGPGGAGKTRLCIESAARLAAERPGLVRDGVWFVELTPLTGDAEVSQAVLAALGLRERVPVGVRGGAPAAHEPMARLTEALRGRRMLLVLDNCEHVVEAVAAFAARLLAACPGVRILATSREALSVAGERLLPVPSLDLPPEGTGADRAAQYASVRLFTERVGAVLPGFAVNDGNVAQVVRLCRELDGMPLALELAAARVRTMPLARLSDRLSDRFRLLAGGNRLALPRHRTLLAVVDWSWELLDDAERALLRRLSVFAGGATLDAVQQVCADDAEAGVIAGRDVWSVLFALVDKSLVQIVDSGGDGTDHRHYGMLETVRAYGARRLAEAGETTAVRAAHAARVLRLWREGDPQLRGAGQRRWLARLRGEQDDHTAALRWALEVRDTGLALDLTLAAHWYWQIMDGWMDFGGWAAKVLELAGDRPPPGKELAYAACLSAVGMDGRSEERRISFLERALGVLREAGLRPRDHPSTIVIPGILALVRGEGEKGLDTVAEWRDHPDPWLRATALYLEGTLAIQVGQAERAYASLSVAVEEYRSLGEGWGTAQGLVMLTDILRFTDPEREREMLLEGLGLTEGMGTGDYFVMFRLKLALSHAERGERDDARTLLDLARGAVAASVLSQQEMRIYIDFVAAEVDRLLGDRGSAREGFTRVRSDLAGTAEVGTLARVHLDALTRDALARLAVDDGDAEAAREHLAVAWTALEDASGDAFSTATLLETMAALAERDGEPERSAVLLGFAGLARGIPGGIAPEAVPLRERLRASLGADGFARAHARGAGGAPDRLTAEVRAWVGSWR
ncbi:BTAD domain-containing putative transcriptional regulator [Actinorugispora endophytica]|uniref:Putative ATPase n=1 Tax=Actinorugispora endophytica TaxID=1605990 RepID=A0A4R6UTG6_9ACTN|nr:BTAD domain-containing putative transcriptional regulator [Actinorugispora endophytica]TDQ49556.1 putative ATPase [Actinorugispora endophytica]